MANTYKLNANELNASGSTTIYTAPAGTTTLVKSLYIANVSSSGVTIDVILEMTELTPLEARIVVNRAQGVITEQVEFDQLNLSEDLTQQVRERYENLSPQEKDAFDKNYRQHTIESYMSGGFKAFTKFYDILPIGKSAGGMGKGEIQILLAVAGSQPGGTASHDIVMPGGEWEVKEIGKLPRPTKSGEMGKAPEGKTFWIECHWYEF